MMAFDLKEPWGTHRKYEVFEDKHSALFGKPYVTADRIVMLRAIDNEIVSQLSKFIEELLAKYKLTRYMLMFMLREMLYDDKMFQEIIQNPSKYMRTKDSENKFRESISVFIGDIIVDINEESKEFGADFDYRGKIKDADWVKEMTKTIQKGFQKNVNRGRQETFETEWNRINFASSSPD
ncbi:hypothetical protein LFADAHJC_LOCUS4392 [Methylorubrum extorquens]